MKPGGREIFVCVLLVLSTGAAFYGVAGNDFIEIDDPEYITQNPHVTGGLTADNLRWALTTFQAGNWHPLTWWVHMADVELFGLDAGMHHLTSLLFHIASSLVLFFVFRRMTGALWSSAFVAALFALHPAHVESVAWACEKKDVVSTLFWFLTMGAYVRYARRPSLARYLPVFLLFSIGLTAKQMLVTLPFALLLLDYWPLRRLETESVEGGAPHRLDARRFLRLFAEKIPLFAVAAAVSIVTLFAQQAGGHVKAIEKFPLGVRAANAVVSYATYLVQLVWPAELGMFYLHPKGFAAWKVAGAAAVLIALSALVLRAGRRHRYLIVGWLWYVGTLVPVIGLLQVGNQALADRYTYVPYIGLFILVAWGGPALARGLRLGRPALAAAAVLVLVAFGTRTWFQIRHWKDSITILEHTVSVDPNNYVLHDVVGSLLGKEGRYEDAIRHYNESIRIRPSFAWSHFHLGVVSLHQQRYTDAVAHFSDAVRLQPEFLVARFNLAASYLRLNQLDQAVEQYYEVIRMEPQSVEAQRQLGRIFQAQKKHAAAAKHIAEAKRLEQEKAASR